MSLARLPPFQDSGQSGSSFCMTSSKSARSTTSAASSELGDCTGFAGFGPIIEKKLSAALEKPATKQRFKLSVAEAEAEALVAFLRNGGRVVVAGSYRRRRDTVGDLDVVVTAADGATVGNKLVAYENVVEVLAHGPTRTTVVLRSGLQVDVRAVPEESYGAALLYFTGSQAHNIALRGLAAASRLEAQRVRLVFRPAADCRPHRRRNLQKTRTGLHPTRTARGSR